MNVLVLQSELGVLWGGGETFTTSLFKAFVRRGHRVTAAFVADRRGCYPRTLPGSFETVPIPGLWNRTLGQTTLSKIGGRLPKVLKPSHTRVQDAIGWRTVRWHNRRFRRRVESTFASRWGQFDAVYVNGNVPLACAAAGHRPTVLMLPGPVSEHEVDLLTRIHAVCAHDDGLTDLRRWMGGRANELPLGLDCDLFSPGPTPVRAQLGWSDSDLVFGYVGRLALIKGVDLLAAAFAQVARDVPHAKLLIVGSGDEAARIKFVLAGECASGRVHLQPATAQDALPAWYRAMNVLVMPSRYETMSNAVLEGMACGVPFLASAVGGSRDLVSSGAGWLCQPESVESLVFEMKEAAARSAHLQGYGHKGTCHVRRQYSWSASAARLEEIMRTRLGVAE